MNKLFFVIAAVFGAGLHAEANAGYLNIDARTDYVSYTANDAAAKPNYEAFQMTRLKLDYFGKLGELNSIRARLDPLLNTSATATRDKTSKFIDFAFLSRKLTDQWNFTMGKYISGMGGVEGANNPGDVYQRSTAGNEVAQIYWPVGAQAEGVFGDHRIRINAGNNTEDVNKGGSLNQTRGLKGLTYTSKLMDGMVMPNLSYHLEDFISTSNATKNNSYLAAGTKIVVSSFEIEADYLENKYAIDAQVTGDILDTQSAILLVRYNIADLGSFQLKYEGTTQRKATSALADTTYKINGSTAAFEYKPTKDENWRMHIAYTQKDTSPDNADLQSEKIVYVGMRIIADILK